MIYIFAPKWPYKISDTHAFFRLIGFLLIAIINVCFVILDICQEGLFRKTGQLARQRQLRERLQSGCHVREVVAELSTSSYSAHDGANFIKTLLGELPEPLLTEKHYNVQCQVASM